MPAYHQMGHNSTNLLRERGLRDMAGAILSPLNLDVEKTQSLIRDWDGPAGFQFILDPQLYNVKDARSTLREWPYYPADLETGDLSRKPWWTPVIDGLADVARQIRCDGVCSPVSRPRSGASEYYDLCVASASELAEALQGTGIRTYLTAFVKLEELGVAGTAERIATVLTRSSLDDVYLVIETNVEPRRELSDLDGLKGVMRLIHLLSESEMRVLVSHCSSDVVLWKAAGAHSCATGKFFNLRRYTHARFEEPGGGGGGQLPYWLEQNLLAFLRESDVIRVHKAGLLGGGASTNTYSESIVANVTNTTQKPDKWLAASWQHYLATFTALERVVATGDVTTAKAMTLQAERNWRALEDAEVLMEEQRNTGEWVRNWRRALIEFNQL